MSRDLQQRIRSLRSTGRGVKPDQAWVKKTREILCMQVRNSSSTESVRSSIQFKQLVHTFVPDKLIHMIRGPVMAAFSIVLMLLGGSVASVSAAEYSLPGDFLYSLKLATEQARLALTNGKQEKLKLKVEFTTRRGEDLKKVATTDSPTKQERVVQAAEILKRDLNTLKQQLDDVKSETESKTTVEVAKLVDQKSNELMQVLQDTKSSLPQETKDKVAEAQAAAADTGVKAIEVLIEQHTQGEESILETEVVKAIEDHKKTVADATGTETLAAASSSLVTATGTEAIPLQQVVDEIKTATIQAFATQKADEHGTSSTQATGVSSASSTSEIPPIGTSMTTTTSGTGESQPITQPSVQPPK